MKRMKILPERSFVRAVLKQTWRQMREARLLMVASSLAYTTILSVIPLLAVSFAIFNAFGGLKKLYSLLQPIVIENLAEGTSIEVMSHIEQFVSNAHANVIGVGGLLALVLTSMSMLSSVENAINHLWKAPGKRNLFQRISSYWFFVTLGPLAFSVVLGTATSADFPLYRLFPSGTGMFLATVVFFTLIYRWVPNTKVYWRYAFLSGLLTATLWNIARSGYSLYTHQVLTYHKIYGSLGAVPIILLWIYIGWVLVLGGAAFNVALQITHENPPK